MKGHALRTSSLNIGVKPVRPNSAMDSDTDRWPLRAPYGAHHRER
jgi:hypothetical protein